MQSIDNIKFYEAKLTATTDQKYSEIDYSSLINNSEFKNINFVSDFTVTYFSDEKGIKEITNTLIINQKTDEKNKETKNIFFKVTTQKDDKLFSGSTQISPLKLVIFDPRLDSNNDGISDYNSITGYTIENGAIVPWNQTKHFNKKYTKYISDPYKKSTTGDPFSDADKVLGKIDQSILIEARHPLVAAYPNIGLEMEKLILTKNYNISTQIGKSSSQENNKSITHSMSNSSSDSHTVEAGAGSSGVSAGYSYNHTTTATKSDSSSSTVSTTQGSSWTHSLSMNTSDSALLSGNIRYINIATAPVYHALSTLNFVLGEAKRAQTIATIIAKPNTTVNCLLPNKIYPERDQNAIAWNTSDDFNSQPIKLNYDQVTALDLGDKLQIQTTQTSGYYKMYNLDEEVQMYESQKWEYKLIDIFKRTACITIAFKNGEVKQRRVAARNRTNYNQQSQPEITLAEAIKIAFLNAEITNDGFTYNNIKISKEDIRFDVQTLIDQKEVIAKNPLEVILTQGMNIVISEKSITAIIEEITQKNANMQTELIKAIKKSPIRKKIIVANDEKGEEVSKRIIDNTKKQVFDYLKANNCQVIKDRLPREYRDLFDEKKFGLYNENIYTSDIIPSGKTFPQQFTEIKLPLTFNLQNINFVHTTYFYLVYKENPIPKTDYTGIYIPINITYEVIDDYGMKAQIKKVLDQNRLSLTIIPNKITEIKDKVFSQFSVSNSKLIFDLLPKDYQNFFDSNKLSILFSQLKDMNGKDVEPKEFYDLDKGIEAYAIMAARYETKTTEYFSEAFFIINIKIITYLEMQKQIKNNADSNPILLEQTPRNPDEYEKVRDRLLNNKSLIFGLLDPTAKSLIESESDKDSKIIIRYDKTSKSDSDNPDFDINPKYLYRSDINFPDKTEEKRNIMFIDPVPFTKEDFAQLAPIVDQITIYVYMFFATKITNYDKGIYVPVNIKFVNK